MFELQIDAIKDNGKQTVGLLSVYDDLKNIYNCKTLELPWKNNEQRVSCFPDGKYKCKKRYSKKYSWHIHILNVPNRTFILIHAANFVRQLLGCVAVGKDFTDIDGDGLRDVTSSKATLKKLLSFLPDEFILTVNRNYLK